MTKKVLIVGAGFGLSYSLARLFHDEGMQITLAARNINKFKDLNTEIKAR